MPIHPARGQVVLLARPAVKLRPNFVADLQNLERESLLLESDD